MIQFSIIIPHKNIPRLLERCLASIPDCEDIQVIIVDDNSDSDIVDFKHFPGKERRYTEVYETKEGRGAGYARNVGIFHAKGKWLLFADADDFFTADFVSIINQYKDSSYDVILFPVKIVDSNTLEAGTRDQWINNVIFQKELTEQTRLATVIIPVSKLIKRTLIEKHSLLFEEITYSNDTMFGTQLATVIHSAYIDTEHYIYIVTQRSGSLTTNRSNKALRCRLGADIRAYQYLKKHNKPELMCQISGKYLPWAAEIGKKEVIHTIWELFTNGLLFHKSPTAWKNRYYNNTWYHIYRALLK